MKKMKIYAIVDHVSQNLLRVFQAVSNNEACRAFEMFVKQSLNDVPDKSDIVLVEMLSNRPDVNFDFSIPECYSDVLDGEFDFFKVLYDANDVSEKKDS